MKFIDFFAGIGCFSLALEKAGFEKAGYCEIDSFAVKSYNAIHNVKEGDYWYEKDIRNIEPKNIPKADIWTAGFPCQDISVSNSNGKGLDGSRSGLFFELVRLLKGTKTENRPDWLIIENVKNLLSINSGWDFTTVLYSLASLGYDIEYGLLNSRFFGIPQNRERVFIVARRYTGTRSRQKVFPISGTDGKGVIQLIGGAQGARVYSTKGSSVSLTANGGGWGAKTGLYLTNFSFMDLNKKSVLTNISRCVKARINAGVTNRSGDNSGVLCVCVRALITPDRMVKRQNGRRMKENGEPMFCLTTQDRHGIAICKCENCMFNMDMETFGCCIKIRKLTPREAWRLQAIEDRYFDKAAAVNSDAQLYKQAGNSVTVSVVYAIALKIKEIVESEREAYEI